MHFEVLRLLLMTPNSLKYLLSQKSGREFTVFISAMSTDANMKCYVTF